MWELMEQCALADGDVAIMRGQAKMCKKLVDDLKKAGVRHA
jgi:hypothetical protein